MELIFCSNHDGYSLLFYELTGKAQRSPQIRYGNFHVGKLFDLALNSLRRKPFLSFEFKQTLLQNIAFSADSTGLPVERISLTYGGAKTLNQNSADIN